MVIVHARCLQAPWPPRGREAWQPRTASSASASFRYAFAGRKPVNATVVRCPGLQRPCAQPQPYCRSAAAAACGRCVCRSWAATTATTRRHLSNCSRPLAPSPLGPSPPGSTPTRHSRHSLTRVRAPLHPPCPALLCLALPSSVRSASVALHLPPARHAISACKSAARCPSQPAFLHPAA